MDNPQPNLPPVKRGRGRPSGSPNKKKAPPKPKVPKPPKPPKVAKPKVPRKPSRPTPRTEPTPAFTGYMVIADPAKLTGEEAERLKTNIAVQASNEAQASSGQFLKRIARGLPVAHAGCLVITDLKTRINANREMLPFELARLKMIDPLNTLTLDEALAILAESDARPAESGGSGGYLEAPQGGSAAAGDGTGQPGSASIQQDSAQL